MEILREYWYVVLGLIVLLYFMSRSTAGGSLTQTRAGTDTVALAQIASAEREADEARRFGVAGSLLQYDLGLRGLGLEREQSQAATELQRLNISQQIDLARISASTQNAAAASALQLAQLQANANNYANQLQYQLAQYQATRAYNAQRRNDWLGAITTGIQTILPAIFGSSTSGGGFHLPQIGGGTAPTFPSGGWSGGWSF